MIEFVSEPITPHRETFDASRMGRGEPGAPTGFVWRGISFAILQMLESWKESSREGSSAQGQLYLRRHYYRLQMSDGAVWTVYFVRQTPRSGDPRSRWFLYSIER
jgi:hypothetical protein